AVGLAARPAIVGQDVAALGPSEPCKLLAKRPHPRSRTCIVSGKSHQHADSPHILGSLRVRHEWPHRCRAPKKSDELASLHVLPSTRGSHPITLECRLVHHSKFACTMSLMGHFQTSTPAKAKSALHPATDISERAVSVAVARAREIRNEVESRPAKSLLLYE